MGPEVPHCLDHEVPLQGAGRGRRSAGSRAAARDRTKSGDGDPCRFGEQRPCASTDLDTAADFGLASSPILEGKEFAQVALGVPALEEALLGTASVGSGVLGL